MAETSPTAKMAAKLSDEVFAEFFWEKVGPIDQNWPCEDHEHHGVDTHPADVVFYYDEPYSLKRTFVHCDLKSYGKTTITATAVHGAIESLAKQVACAEKSEKWRDLYMHGNVTPEVCGLLFVYNHDGGYEKDFSSHLGTTKDARLPLPKGSRLFVLGPEEIAQPDAHQGPAAVVASHLGECFDGLGDRVLDGQRPQGAVAARDAVACRPDLRFDQPRLDGLQRRLDRDELLGVTPGSPAASPLGAEAVHELPANATDPPLAQRGLAFDADRLIVRICAAPPREYRGQFGPPTDAATELNRRFTLRRCATRRHVLEPRLDLAVAALDDIDFVRQP